MRVGVVWRRRPAREVPRCLPLRGGPPPRHGEGVALQSTDLVAQTQFLHLGGAPVAGPLRFEAVVEVAREAVRGRPARLAATPLRVERVDEPPRPVGVRAEYSAVAPLEARRRDVADQLGQVVFSHRSTLKEQFFRGAQG